MLLVVASGGAAAATESPQPVSPGGATDSTLVEARCPTFSWAGAAGAAGYRLAVLRVGLDGQSDLHEPQDPEVVALIDLPADSRSFTPPVGRCLDRGERYAWSVAAVAGEDEPVQWSPAFLFEIEAGREPEGAVSLQQAVEVLELYLSERGVGPGARRDAGAAPASSDAGAQVHLSAASALFKVGDVFLWDDNSAGNTAVGREALESVTTGTGNTAVGRDALRATTGGAAFAGSFNTALGDAALLANTTGKRNTAAGADALLANSTGSGSTATGASALKDNTSGEYNTAVGAFSLRLNFTGDHNIAVGLYALRNNTDGVRNTAVGNYALRTNASGDSNTAMGYGSLRSNAFSYNTALGTNSLRDNSTGLQNTATGRSALLRNTDGDENAAHGNNALANNTTGNRNTAVGEVAGYYATTGSHLLSSLLLAELKDQHGELAELRRRLQSLEARPSRRR